MLRLFVLTVLLTAPVQGAAQGILRVVPRTELSESTRIDRSRMKSVPAIVITAAGEEVQIAYSAGGDISCDIGPLRADGKGDPQDLVHFTLPAGKRTAAIDLTMSPGWAPWSQPYLLACMEYEGDQTAFGDPIFVPARLTTIARTALQHLGKSEVYQASSVHTLRGYRTIGIPLGLVLTLCAGIAIVAIRKWKAANALVPSLVVLLATAFVYQSWFALDLLTMTSEHLLAWENEGTYSQLGSVEMTAESIRRAAFEAHVVPSVFVCTTGSDFYTKALRYFLAPGEVFQHPEHLATARFIVVHDAPGWSTEDGVLRCGRIEGGVRKIQEFPDGSVLFATFAS
jgi:hypothetical protein